MTAYTLTRLTREQWDYLLSLAYIEREYISASADSISRSTDLAAITAIIAEIHRTMDATPELRGEDR